MLRFFLVIVVDLRSWVIGIEYSLLRPYAAEARSDARIARRDDDGYALKA